MNELFVGLGLLTFPVAVFVFFGNWGMGSFPEGTGASSRSVVAKPGLVALAPECADCHGRLAQGTSRVPNLIHPDYGPAKRSDAQFRRAVREGMPSRKGYGEMPATPGMSEHNLNRMIALVRELQRVGGIR